MTGLGSCILLALLIGWLIAGLVLDKEPHTNDMEEW